MPERFADAALRHLETAEVLENEGRRDDAAYHYGLVGETAIKAAVVAAVGSLPGTLKRHINESRRPSLQDEVARSAVVVACLASGRQGGALLSDINNGRLGRRFTDWTLNIRYADDDCCPVSESSLAVWKADAVALYNAGVF